LVKQSQIFDAGKPMKKPHPPANDLEKSSVMVIMKVIRSA